MESDQAVAKEDLQISSHNILFHQNKVLFEMLKVLIDHVDIKDGSIVLGYDFSDYDSLFDE